MPARRKPWLSDELVALLTGDYWRWLIEDDYRSTPLRRRFKYKMKKYKRAAFRWAGIGEAVYVDFSWRFWLVRFAFTPRATVCYLVSRFKMYTMLPGDRFEDFQRDERYEVTEVRADYVLAMVVHRIHSYLPGGPLPMVDIVKCWRVGHEPGYSYDPQRERTMRSWIPYKGEL